MKKQNIKEAALKLLIQNGVHATPMSAIAKAANTGMGTIYNHFATKEILINAIYLDIKEQLETLMREPSHQPTIQAQFEHYYRLVTSFYLEQPDYFKFMDQLQSSPIISEETRAEGYKTMHPVISILKKGQQEGIIKDMEIDVLLQFVGGTVLAHLAWLINGDSAKTKKSSLNDQLRLVWDAIKQ